MGYGILQGVKAARAGVVCLVTALVCACSGGGGGGASVTPTGFSGGGGGSVPSSGAVAPPPNPLLGVADCLPSGLAGAVDYQVGTGKAYASLDQVPWENLQPGDTVRIFYRAAPFPGKFAITSSGTSTAPIRVCGVRGPANERPVVDGSSAITRTVPAYRDRIASSASVRNIHEDRSLVLIKNNSNSPGYYTDYPQYIQIDGLSIKRAYPSYQYTDSAGATRTYTGFGACIWVDRGHHITIADNEISDCMQAIYTKSTDDGDFAVTRDIRIAGNYLWGNGYTGDASNGADREHTTYTASKDIVIEFNRYGPLRSGGLGNAIKDRSVGTVVRYNRIEEGAHAIDLVEAEDFYVTALADPAYRATWVYGNQIVKNGDTGSVIHYGGDHIGPGIADTSANYGERLFRKGALYFFNNTVYLTGSNGAQLFQISTTEETVEAWNNIFHFDASIRSGFKALRAVQDVASGYVSGGILNLGKNWITTGWSDSDIYHPISGGSVNGLANLMSATSPPMSLSTLALLNGSVAIDAGQSNPPAASAVVVDYQLNGSFQAIARPLNGTAIDLGALEH